jgi:hypothetical protein
MRSTHQSVIAPARLRQQGVRKRRNNEIEA